VTAGQSEQYASARDRALGFLARREHAERELVFKLSQGSAAQAYDDEIAAQVVADLRQEGLQSNERFIEMLTRHRHNNGHGPTRLAAELARWGLSPVDFDLDWVRACVRVMRKRFGAKSAQDLKERAKRQRYLAGRGFTSEQIAEAFTLSAEEDQV